LIDSSVVGLLNSNFSLCSLFFFNSATYSSFFNISVTSSFTAGLFYVTSFVLIFWLSSWLSWSSWSSSIYGSVLALLFTFSWLSWA
jgi:hypothetical protein